MIPNTHLPRSLKILEAERREAKRRFSANEIFHKQLFRKITKEEACLIQGFPISFQLPESRGRWMKLLGNGVSAPVIEQLGQAILSTGCIEGIESAPIYPTYYDKPLNGTFAN